MGRNDSAMSRTWLGRRLSGRSAAEPSAAEPPAGAVSPGGTVPAASPAPAPLITIDALGRKCPIPIIWLSEQIRDVPIGSVIAVLADDPAAYSDIPAWCEMKSHSLAFREAYKSGWSFGIRRNY